MTHKTYNVTYLGDKELLKQDQYMRRSFEHPQEVIDAISYLHNDHGHGASISQGISFILNEHEQFGGVLLDDNNDVIAMFTVGSCDCGVTDEEIEAAHQGVLN